MTLICAKRATKNVMTKIKIPKADAFSYLGFDKTDLEDMEGLAERNAMWERRLEFAMQLLDMNRYELSGAQMAYAVRILDDLEAKRRRGKL